MTCWTFGRCGGWPLLVGLITTGLVAKVGADDGPVTITTTDTHLEFRAGEALITRYQYAGTVPLEKGEGQKPLAKPFFYPLVAPNGVGVTRGWPIERGQPGEATDHVHQKSAWFCHGDVIAEGLTLTTRSADKRVRGVDFWSETPGHGRIVCQHVTVQGSTATTRNSWQTADGISILHETRIIRGQLLPKGRLLTLEIELTATDYPIIFGDTKEGSLGIRIHDEIALLKPTGGVITTSTGQQVAAPKTGGNLPIWGQPADWHDYSGRVAGQAVGLALFDDPRNPHRALWHTRDYGLMAANPFGRHASGFPAMKTDAPPEARLAKGERLKLRYGLYVHDGDATSGQVAEAFARFQK